jgi:biopolymer transport protein ExbD
MSPIRFHGTNPVQPMAEINMIPMIDVMLVLLIVFMITAPLLTHAVKLQLPQANSTPNPSEPQSVMLSLDADLHCYWNGESISREVLTQKLAQLGTQENSPSIQLYVDRQVPYAELASLLAEAAHYGLQKIAFVMTPESSP